MNARTQRGVALLTAVLVVALATILLASMLDRNGVSYARTRNLSRAAQADALALGLEDWAKDILRRDEANLPERDTIRDAWATPLPPTPVPGGQVAGVMRDLNGCFNLNGLYRDGQRSDAQIARFTRLLLALKLNPDIAAAAADWVDSDLQPDLLGAEDQYYLSRQPAYRAPNRAFAHVSELRLVRGVDDDTYAALAPHVCALPVLPRRGPLDDPWALNVNTATLAVLMSLSEQMTEPMARQLWREGQADYANTSVFMEALRNVGVSDVPEDGLSVRSVLFEARAEVRLEDLPFSYISVIERSRTGLRVLSRGPAN
jgi:general secretion pathway protein K